MKISVLYTFILSILFLTPLKLTAQNDYSFRQIAYEEGLPGNNIKYQYIDSRGIMWISLEGIGLCKYNGHKFTLYSASEKKTVFISSNFINQIEEDDDGYIWLATDFGLSRYDYKSGTFTNFFHNPNDTTSIPDNVVLNIINNNDGNLWIGTTNGMALLDFRTFKCRRYLYTPPKQNAEKDQIHFIYKSKNKSLWVGTYKGLKKLIPYNNTYITDTTIKNIQANLQDKRIYDCIEDNLGRLWIATNKGLFHINIGTEKVMPFNFDKNHDNIEINQNGINSLLFENKNTLWVGTWTKGLAIIDITTNSYKRITVANSNRRGISSDHIRGLYKDREETIWVSAKYGGINQYLNKNNIFNNANEKYKALLPLNEKYLVSILEDNDSIIWLGTKFSGMFHINLFSEEVKNYHFTPGSKNSISSNQVHSIFRDSKNRLWVGTKKGLDLLNEKTGHFTNYFKLTINNIYEDKAGNIWVGTELGIFIIKPESHSLGKYKLNDKYKFFSSDEYHVINIYEDKAREIWFSTKYKGVFRFNPYTKTLKRYAKTGKSDLKFNANMVRPVMEGKNNTFWIGTKEAGLNHLNLNTNKLDNYTVKDGLPSNMIMSIQKDFLGSLWLGTNNGISRFNIWDSSFTNFNKDHGLKSSVIEIGASHRFNDGAILFGGSNGFNVFYPTDVIIPSSKDSILISEIEIFNNVRYRDINKTETIQLNHYENQISFEFNLKSYIHPSRHEFMCQMVGIDDEWVHLGNRNYASYKNIKPGSYIFKVKGANEISEWSDILSINIEIRTPWWDNILYKIIIGVFISILAFLFYYVRIKQMQLQRKELKKQVHIRTKELNDSNKLLIERQSLIEDQSKELSKAIEDLKISNATKDKLYSIIAHDLKNPFNTIMGFNNILLRKFDTIDDEKKKDFLRHMLSSSKKVFVLLEDLLQWSKSQSDSLQYNPEFVNIYLITKEILELFEMQLNNKNIVTENNVSIDQEAWCDKEMIKAVLRNIISNAIKFTNNGTITIKSRISKGELTIDIKDTGTGIEQEVLDEIFKIDKVKSTSGTNGEAGSGLGLILCHEFMNINDGTITINSKVEEGTIVTITLPAIKPID